MQDDAGVGRRDIGGHRFTLVADSRSPPPACDAAANGRALVEITDRADPVIAVRHDERESEGEVAANNKNWRQRLSLVDFFRSSSTCGSSRGKSGSSAARSKSLAAWSTIFVLRRFLTSALTLASEAISERYFRAASKSEAAP